MDIAPYHKQISIDAGFQDIIDEVSKVSTPISSTAHVWTFGVGHSWTLGPFVTLADKEWNKCVFICKFI